MASHGAIAGSARAGGPRVARPSPASSRGAGLQGGHPFARRAALGAGTKLQRARGDYLKAQAASRPAVNSTPNGRITGERVKTKSPERLDDPANIGTCAAGSIEVYDVGAAEEGHLENYMRLPIEQYVVLDGAQISRLGNDVFKLTVPRMEFFDVWIEPTLTVQVRLEEGGKRPLVVMESQACDIRGSPLIQSMRLNDRFEMYFKAELAWQPNPEGGVGKMLCKSAVDVWCETIPPFNLLPRPTLESGSNAVLDAFTPTLLNLFLRNLASDYATWAADSAYRADREAKAASMFSDQSALPEALN